MDTSLQVLDTEEDSSHCHSGWKGGEGVMGRNAFKKLLKASLLCLFFMIVEIIGGVLANSLAIATDAAHLFTDLAGFGIGLLAIYLSSRPPSKRLSFGWYRAEVLGAMLSVLTIWLVTVVLVYLAVMRVISGDYEINAIIMMVTAGLGMLFNVSMMVTLGHTHSHSHSPPITTNSPLTPPPSPIPLSSTPSLSESDSSIKINIDERTKLVEKHEKNSKNGIFNSKNGNHNSNNHSHNNDNDSHNSDNHSHNQDNHSHSKKVEDINVRAAMIHVIGDLVQSVGVFVASVLIYFKPTWKIADPICTFIFSVLVLFTTINILMDIIRVLMEGTPTNISFNEVKDSLSALEGVKEVHNLRIWSLTTSRIALSAHLVVYDSALSHQVMTRACKMLQRSFNIEEATVQVEVYVAQMDDCSHCKLP